MEDACLPIEIPNIFTGKWTANSRLRWLKWLLEFQRMELSRLTRNQQDALCQNLINFCCAYPFGIPSPKGVPRSERLESLDTSVVKPMVKYIQGELRRGLRILVLGETVELIDPNNVVPQDFKDSPGWNIHRSNWWEVPIEASILSLWRAPEYKTPRGAKARPFKSGAIEYYLRAGWPDIFWLAVADLLRIHGDGIRQCPKQDCGKVFIRTKRQDYCSTQCSQIERSKKHYAANREKRKKDRRARYERQMKTKYGQQKIRIKHRVAQ